MEPTGPSLAQRFADAGHALEFPSMFPAAPQSGDGSVVLAAAAGYDMDQSASTDKLTLSRDGSDAELDASLAKATAYRAQILAQKAQARDNATQSQLYQNAPFFTPDADLETRALQWVNAQQAGSATLPVEPLSPSPLSPSIDFQPIDVQVAAAQLPLPGPAMDPSPIGLNVTSTDPFLRGFAGFVHNNLVATDKSMHDFRAGAMSQLRDETNEAARNRDTWGIWTGAIKQTAVSLLPDSQLEVGIGAAGGAVIGKVLGVVGGAIGGRLVSRYPWLNTNLGEALGKRLGNTEIAGAGRTLNASTYTGDVYSPDFVGPVQWKYFYRGDATARTDFLSSMAQERGVQATTDFLNNRATEPLSEIYAQHGVGSQGLPTIGVSDNPAVAEYFARGPYQNQNGFVTTFRLSPQDAETFAIPNYENDYSFFENNPDIGLPEREYLFHVQIDPKYAIKQVQVGPK